jgi:oxygen-independent coproporphyrinogen-3 oxidase
VLRGIELSRDDLLRRAVIQALCCQFAVAKESFEIAYLIDSTATSPRRCKDLRELAAGRPGRARGRLDHDHAARRGCWCARVCMVFDRYLRATQERERYSRVV